MSQEGQRFPNRKDQISLLIERWLTKLQYTHIRESNTLTKKNEASMHVDMKKKKLKMLCDVYTTYYRTAYFKALINTCKKCYQQ